MQAQALPDAITGDVAGVEDGNDGLAAWHQATVQPNEDGGVAGIFGDVLTTGHGGIL
jgi:hypothetical protein